MWRSLKPTRRSRCRHLRLALQRVGDPPVLKRGAQDVAHRLARVERRIRVLEDNLGNVVVIDPLEGGLAGGVACDVLEHFVAVQRAAFVKNLSGSGGIQPGQDSAQGGFAAAAFAHQPERLAWPYRQVDAIHGAHAF